MSWEREKSDIQVFTKRMERTGRKEQIFGNLIPFTTETYNFHKKEKQDLKEVVCREKIAGYNVEKLTVVQLFMFS